MMMVLAATEREKDRPDSFCCGVIEAKFFEISEGGLCDFVSQLKEEVNTFTSQGRS